ncbi:MAG: plasmid mobilization relaxosome protein MobC [Rikenellaceae bacterium]
MPKRERLVGRPPKEIEDKLCKSINIKLTIDDYCNLIDRSKKLNITPTAYARQLVVSGRVVSPFSGEELQLLRALAGEANNLNQIAKHLNSGEMQHKLTACAVIIKLKKILDDSKKY